MVIVLEIAGDLLQIDKTTFSFWILHFYWDNAFIYT